MCKSQGGFYGFVVIPLLTAFTRVFPACSPLLGLAQANLQCVACKASRPVLNQSGLTDDRLCLPPARRYWQELYPPAAPPAPT